MALHHSHEGIRHLPFPIPRASSLSLASVTSRSLLCDSSRSLLLSLSPSHLMSWGKRELGTLWVVPAGYATTRHKSMRVWHTPTCCVELGGEKRTETALHNGKNPLPSSPLTLAACWISCISCRISATTSWFSTKFLCAVCGFLKDNQRRKALDSFVCLFVLPFFFPLVLAPFYKLFLRC